MFVLDTNHLRELSLRTPAGDQLQRRLEQREVNVATTVVCSEENQRGWLALISRARKPSEEVLAYAQLAESINFLATLLMLLGMWKPPRVSTLSDNRAFASALWI